MIVLNKKKDKDFLVLNFTDLHIKDRHWNSDNVRKKIPLHIINTLTEQVKPDLITVTGDISCGFQYDSYSGIADLFEGFGIPWAVIWGNHDTEDGEDSVCRVESSYLSREHFVYESGDPVLGHGNYVIGIEEEGVPVEALIMMDTHSRLEYTDDNGEIQTVNSKLTEAQKKWYSEQVSELKKRGYRESSLFIHIPIYAYLEAFESAITPGIDPYSVSYEDSFSEKIWRAGYEGSFGVMHDRITPCPFDDGMLESILQEGHTRTVLCGHDHKNSFVITYKGVRLAYSLRSGNSSYHRPQALGGTLLRIGSDGVKSVEHLPVSVSQLDKE